MLDRWVSRSPHYHVIPLATAPRPSMPPT